MKQIYLNIIALLMVVVPTFAAEEYDKFLDKSFDCIEVEDWECAEESLIAALRSDPTNNKNSLVLSNLGTIQRNMGKYNEAIRSYSNALMLTPKSVTLLSNRAALYTQIDSLELALNDYNRIIGFYADEERAIYDRAMIHLQMADTVMARMDLERLLKLNPNSFDAHVGMATLMMYRDYYKEAVDIYTILIDRDKEIDTRSYAAKLFLSRAEAYLYQKKLSKAVADINKSITLSADDAIAYMLRAEILWGLYEKDLALKDLEKAKELGVAESTIEGIIKDLLHKK